MTDALLRIMSLAALAMLMLSCASSEQKTPIPVLIEQADKTISSGVSSYKQSDYARAEDLFIKALYRYRGIDNPEGVAASCINLAKTRLSQGDTDAARQWIDSARNTIETSGLEHLQNHLTIASSSIAIETRDFETAKRLLAPLLDETGGSIDHATKLAALQNRTRIAFAESDAASSWADKYAEQIDPDDPLHRARLSRFRAALSTDMETGDAHFNAALAIYREQAYRPGIAATLKEWAQRDIELKRYSSAQHKLERALFVRAEMSDLDNCRKILELYARLFTEQGDAQALRSTREWIRLTGQAGFDDWLRLMQAYSSYPDS